MSRRLRAYPAIALLLLALVALGQARIDAAEPAKPSAWTFSHCCSPNTGWGTAVQVWAERIKQESNGRFESEQAVDAAYAAAAGSTGKGDTEAHVGRVLRFVTEEIDVPVATGRS